MRCNQIRELLPDLAAGIHASTQEVQDHIASCKACADHLVEFEKTMALLDEWRAPEPSLYFDARLQARLREEIARPQVSWFGWLRRPVWAASLAAILFAGALTIGVTNRSYVTQLAEIPVKPPAPGLPVQPGTAVGDLQALDRNDDLYADFDMLDELQVQDNVTANP